MQAARIHRYGGPEVFRIEEVQEPKPGRGQVRVQVHASSVNPVDFKIRGGGQRAVIWLKFPAVLGMDVSGTILEVGPGVSDFQVGDEVFSSPNHFQMGCYAEQVLIKASELARKPKNLSHEEAASIPLVGLTAYRALVTKGKVQAGERVLIQAGSGGVGTFAIQLAKHLGAEVITTCSEPNHPLVRSLGADQVIDYRKVAFEEVAGEVDVVLDMIGGDHLERGLSILRKGGRLLSITPRMPDFTKKYGPALGLVMLGGRLANLMMSAKLKRGVGFFVVTRTPDGGQLQKIAELIEEGAIKPVIDKTFKLSEIAEAHSYLETGRARGKVVISVRR